MLFNPTPKENKEDLFNRDKELRRLVFSLRSGPPLILLLGVRRVGKTSLLKVGLKEAGQPTIYLDMRRFAETGYSRQVFFSILAEELEKFSSQWKRVGNLLSRVRGVELAGVKFELDFRRGHKLVTSLLGVLNDWVTGQKGIKAVVVAMDEAQLLKNFRGGKGRIDFRNIIAYSYDNLPHIKFLLTGSEVGLLMDFIGADDPESPLYGRVREDIVLEKFSREDSLRFLREGFMEHGMEPDENLLQKAVDVLDGVVGWLTYFGYRATVEKRVDEKLLEAVLAEAKAMVESELSHLFHRSRHYKHILRAINEGKERWSEIKRAVELWENMSIPNAQLTRLLETLTKTGVVDKKDEKYTISDPIIRLLL